MLTKRNLWYLSLFSIILVLAVWYVLFPNEKITAVSKDINTKDDVVVTVKESEKITALRVNRDENIEKEEAQIKEILNDDSKTSEEKNDAYEALKKIKTDKGKASTLESLIKKSYNFETFVSIDGNKIKVIVDNKKHSYELANKIIKTIQKEFDEKMYITVTFE